MDGQLTRAAVTRGVVVGAAIAAALTAWSALAGASLLIPHHHRVSAPELLTTVAMWQLMVVGMMTPTVLPWIAAYAKLVAPAEGGRSWRAVGAFVGGYFAVWLAYSVVAAGLQTGLARAGWLLGDRVGTLLGGTVLVAAGAFQFTVLKGACLAHCRNPLTYFLARWHDGPLGGFRLGLSHGAFCLGCCWLVMLTALAMGVMNLAWMAVLTVVMALEQTAPAGVWVGRACGVLLVAWGGWLMSAA